MNQAVFWKGVQFLTVTGAVVAAFGMLYSRFGSISFFGASYGSVIVLLGVVMFVVVAHVFASGMFRQSKENLDEKLKTRFQLEKTSLVFEPVDKKRKLKDLKMELERLKNVKKLLKKSLLTGRVSQKDYDSYERANTKALTNAETKIKELLST
ncbi:MAG: hypothetical protein ACE5DI_06050 [Candidatus Micrarchaeia archaeon]